MSLLKALAVEVWERIRMGAAAAGAAATAMFFDLKADSASGMQSAIESVVAFGNTAANTFEGAYEAIKAIWGLLPAAIGDLAFQAAISLVDGVEATRCFTPRTRTSPAPALHSMSAASAPRAPPYG